MLKKFDRKTEEATGERPTAGEPLKLSLHVSGTGTSNVLRLTETMQWRPIRTLSALGLSFGLLGLRDPNLDSVHCRALRKFLASARSPFLGGPYGRRPGRADTRAGAGEGYRLLATFIGVAASITITGLFS